MYKIFLKHSISLMEIIPKMQDQKLNIQIKHCQTERRLRDELFLWPSHSIAVFQIVDIDLFICEFFLTQSSHWPPSAGHVQTTNRHGLLQVSITEYLIVIVHSGTSRQSYTYRARTMPPVNSLYTQLVNVAASLARETQ